MVKRQASAALIALLVSTQHGLALPVRELTPADAIATSRLVGNQTIPGASAEDSAASPDGRRYVLRVARGDVQRNGIWLDVLTGSLLSFEAAALRPKRCAHLFTSGLGANRDVQTSVFDATPSNQLVWLNNSQVAFLWSDGAGTRQVLSIDLDTCQHRFVTHSRTNVYTFAGNARTLLFNAKLPRRHHEADRLWQQGFTVSAASDGWAILRGNIGSVDLLDLIYDNTWFLKKPSAGVRRIRVGEDLIDSTYPAYRSVSLSPRGRFAITHVARASYPNHWHRYTDSSLESLLERNQTDGHHIPLSYAVIDLVTGDSHPLWDAPLDSLGEIAWRSESALIAPTFLPIDASTPRLSSGAAAVIDVATGHYAVLPVDLTSRAVTHLDWISADTVEIASIEASAAAARVERFHKDHGQWSAAPLAVTAPQFPLPLVRLETRQTLNTPPQVFAVDTRNGDARMLLDLNPRLIERFKLGRVERLSGTLPNGKQWLGQLIYPADYQPGRAYPLVIQSLYGEPWRGEEFTLNGSWGQSGMGLGPTTVPAYPGQLLATRNIAVLELEVVHSARGPEEAEDHRLAFETLAEQLSASGLIDRSRVALDGFSRNGYWVEFTLSHSKFPFAAAIAADNYDPSYFQSALSNWRIEDAEVNGTEAFGSGLQQWLRHAPGFNAEHIDAPLLKIGQDMDSMSYIIGSWEIYSRLRHLKKPVEMYLMPEVDRHPSHTPQNPRQIMAIQEMALDWLSFWLTGREDPVPQKRAQYVRWQALRAARNAAVVGIVDAAPAR